MNFDEILKEIKDHFSIIAFAIAIFEDKDLMAKILVAGIGTVSYIKSVMASEEESVQDAKMLEMLNDDWYIIEERFHLTKEQDDFVIDSLNPTIIKYCKFLLNTFRSLPNINNIKRG